MTFESAPNAPDRKQINPWLRMTLELGPLLLFFVANARGEAMAERFPWLEALGGPLFFATAVFIVAVLVSLSVSYALMRRLPLMPFVTAVVVLVFGGLTLWLQDETFIKMKPTIIYVLFGVVLLGGLAFGKSLLGYVFDAVFKLTDEGWHKLTLRWALFFLALAVLNEVVWRSVSTDTWVAFKVFAILPITFAFTLFQLPLINRHTIAEQTDAS